MGGCHGCLNLNQADNAGLQNIVAKLEQLYGDLGLADRGISHADFWALAGTVAVEIGVKLHQGYTKFVYSRQRVFPKLNPSAIYTLNSKEGKEPAAVLLRDVWVGLAWWDWGLTWMG